MISLAACMTGFVLDFIFGDPGMAVSSGPDDRKRDRALARGGFCAGICGERHLKAAGGAALGLHDCSTLIPDSRSGLLSMALQRIHPGLRICGWRHSGAIQILAARSLCTGEHEGI